MSNHQVLVIIPAYNEEKTVGQVIHSIFAASSDVDVLVVSDGSRDRTESEARKAGAAVITLADNLGIGGAMQTGYRYAVKQGYDYAVQIDADGQHDPADLPRLLAEARKQDANMIIGSRYVAKTGYQSSRSRRIGMIVLSGFVQLAVGYPVKDTTSGYRVADRRVIQLFREYYPLDYPEVEALVLLHRHHIKVREVPVEMHARQAGQSSITMLKSVYYMFKVTLAIGLEVLRKQTTRRDGSL